MNKDNTDNKDYKYILVDRSDPELMWNCAVSIIVFGLLIFFFFMNWKSKCPTTSTFENMLPSIDDESIVSSLGGISGIREI